MHDKPTRRAIICLAVATAVLGVTSSASAASPTPRAAAARTKACLVKHGWSIKPTDEGKGLIARTPRKLNGSLWPHPWYSITYQPGVRWGKEQGPTWEAHIISGLNSSERRLAASCTRAALRAR